MHALMLMFVILTFNRTDCKIWYWADYNLGVKIGSTINNSEPDLSSIYCGYQMLLSGAQEEKVVTSDKTALFSNHIVLQNDWLNSTMFVDCFL